MSEPKTIQVNPFNQDKYTKKKEKKNNVSLFKDSTYIKAVEFMDMDSLEKAATLLDQLITEGTFGEHTGLMNRYGLLRMRQENWQEAENWFKRIHEKNPNYFPAWLNLGIVLTNQGKLDAALNAYREASVLEPNHAKPYLNEGILLVKQQRFAEAKTPLVKARDLSSGRVLTKALTYSALVDYNLEGDEVFELLKEATYRRPDYMYPRYYWVMMSEDPAERAVQLDKILRINPESGLAHFLAAVNAEGRGEEGAAFAHLQAALQLRPAFGKWTGAFEGIFIENAFTDAVMGFSTDRNLIGKKKIDFDKETNR